MAPLNRLCWCVLATRIKANTWGCVVTYIGSVVETHRHAMSQSQNAKRSFEEIYLLEAPLCILDLVEYDFRFARR